MGHLSITQTFMTRADDARRRPWRRTGVSPRTHRGTSGAAFQYLNRLQLRSRGSLCLKKRTSEKKNVAAGGPTEPLASAFHTDAAHREESLRRHKSKLVSAVRAREKFAARHAMTSIIIVMTLAPCRVVVSQRIATTNSHLRILSRGARGHLSAQVWR